MAQRYAALVPAGEAHKEAPVGMVLADLSIPNFEITYTHVEIRDDRAALAGDVDPGYACDYGVNHFWPHSNA
ncbi:hypothetical protein CN179_26685 [Sinorhizobium medicae]|nr:hypothetical protein CN179_26685 [Sinorhizobium medicae]